MVTPFGLWETITPRTLREGLRTGAGVPVPRDRRFEVAFSPRAFRIPATTRPALFDFACVRGIRWCVRRVVDVPAACVTGCLGRVVAGTASSRTRSTVNPGGGLAVIRPTAKPVSRKIDRTRTFPRALERLRCRGGDSVCQTAACSGRDSARCVAKVGRSAPGPKRAARNSPGSGSSALATSASAGSTSASSGLITGTRCGIASTQLVLFSAPPADSNSGDAIGTREPTARRSSGQRF